MKRNILFFFPDQWHADWLGGSPQGANPDLNLKTPVLDSLMAGGIRFTDAFTPSPLCAPARACLASGKAYRECGVANNHADYPLDQPTFYQRLRDRGYRTASVGKLDLHKDLSKPLNWGLDGSRNMADWGFTEGVDCEGKIDGKQSFLEAMKPKGPYLNHLFRKSPALAEAYAREPQIEGVGKNDPYVTVVSKEDYCDNWLAAAGMDYLRNFPKDSPWFIQVNFTGPHGPFDVTREMHDRWKDVDFPDPIDSEESHESANGKRRHYAAMIENIDRLMGEFLALVEERGEGDETLVVFAADHGDNMGEHGRYGKCSWHRGSASVPLVIAGPGIAGRRRTDALVMLQDLTATFLDYGECEPLDAMAGSSLRDILEGRADTHRHAVESELVAPDGNGIDWMMTYDGCIKRVEERKSGKLMIYDLEADPLEMNPEISPL